MSYAIAVDIGGTFTDLVAFDHETQKVIYSKSPTTYDNLVEGILDCFNKAKIKPARGVAGQPRHDPGDQFPDPAQGREDRAGHEPRLSRHSGNRPRQSARSLRSALSARRAIDSARAAPRSSRAHGQQGRSCHAARFAGAGKTRRRNQKTRRRVGGDFFHELLHQSGARRSGRREAERTCCPTST